MVTFEERVAEYARELTVNLGVPAHELSTVEPALLPGFLTYILTGTDECECEIASDGSLVYCNDCFDAMMMGNV